MADPEIVSKKRSSIIRWLFIGTGLIAILFFLTRQPDKKEFNRVATTITSTSSHAAKHKWNTINFNAPAANYNEITSRDIIVKGTNDYAIYSLQEEFLFDRDYNRLRATAIEALRQIANSIEQRYTNGLIRIYEHTQEPASAGMKLQLTQQRVETIRNWFLQNSNLSAKQLTIQPVLTGGSIDSLQTHVDPLKQRHVDIVALLTY